MVPLFGVAYAAPNKGTTIWYWYQSPKTLLNPPATGKIQGLFKAFECFSSTFQVIFFKDFSSILKAIKNATDASAIFPLNISLIHFVFVRTNVPNVGERLTKTWAQLHISVKNLVKNDKFIEFFGNHIKFWNFIQFQRANTAFHSNKQKNGLQHKIHFAGRT